jgi:hypothetical protein
MSSQPYSQQNHPTLEQEPLFAHKQFHHQDKGS